MCGQVHCLHPLLLAATNYSLQHCPKGHPLNYHVIAMTSVVKLLYQDASKCTSLYSFSWFAVFFSTVFFLRVDIAFIFLCFFLVYVCYVYSIKREYTQKQYDIRQPCVGIVHN